MGTLTCRVVYQLRRHTSPQYSTTDPSLPRDLLSRTKTGEVMDMDIHMEAVMQLVTTPIPTLTVGTVIHTATATRDTMKLSLSRLRTVSSLCRFLKKAYPLYSEWSSTEAGEGLFPGLRQLV